MPDPRPRLQLVSPDEPTRPTLTGGQITGRRSRHDERKRLLRDLRAAERWERDEALAAFDGRDRVH